jgi:glycosyltransferase involved in cell wall biosynthesis
MYLGRLSPKKGIENLLHALHELNDSSVSLTIYGTGPADYVASVRRIAEGLTIPEGSVSFAGHVGGDAKTRAFHSSDLCVVPSFSENFCLVVAEALAHGVPVIASHGTPWSRVADKQCGLWVDNSPKSIAEAIIRARSMPLEAMGRRGREWMKSEYGWDAVADAMHQIYKNAGYDWS